MNPERWKEAQRLYHEALERPEAERAAFLRSATPDESLVAQVERMLRSAPAKEFLDPPEPGESESGQILGDFTLQEEIGRGAMGVVYRALQRSLNRTVAVKVLPASFALSPRQIERFEREAQATARLTHPNIVSIVTVGTSAGMRWFAMELIEGDNLAQEIERLRAELEAERDDHAHLPSSHAADYFRSVAELMRQAADGLAHAHAHRIVHRDIKPSNLLLTPEHTIKIVDFGLARDEALGSLSRTGDMMGTPHYMSPEQARAHRHQVDHRTDVYSLGVVLYELLTLRRPFEGKTSQEVITNLLEHEQTPIRRLNRRVPRDLETICGKAMAKQARERYASAAHLRDDLQLFLGHEAIVARPPSAWQRLILRLSRRRVPLALAVAAVLGALIGGLAWRARSDAQRRASHVQFIRNALARAPLSELPPATQIDLRRRLMELRAEGGLRAAESADPLVALERDFDELLERWKTEGRESLRLADDPRRPPGIREERRLAALWTFVQASLVFPEDEELERLAVSETAFPTLTVSAEDESGAPTEALVSLREIDPLTSSVGRRVVLGPAPLPPTPVRPGSYRVVVEYAAGGFGEYACNPGSGVNAVVLTARREESAAAAAQDMVLFPESDYSFPPIPGLLYGEATVHLAAFRLARRETSNTEYARFLSETGHAPPSYWSLIPDRRAFLETYGNLPVVGICWQDAEAYVQWAGLRLPTAAEWLRAAGGLEHRPFPYSTDPSAPARGNVLAGLESPSTTEEQWARYFAHAVPVGSQPEAATPEGLLHMLGNALEMTESLALTLEDEGDVPVPRAFDRFHFGSSWYALAKGDGMNTPYFAGLGPQFFDWYTGFRCAKSEAP